MGVFKTLEVNLSVPIAEYAELSDEELDGVAGGRRTREERRAGRMIIREVRKALKNHRQIRLDVSESQRSDCFDDGIESGEPDY